MSLFVLPAAAQRYRGDSLFRPDLTGVWIVQPHSGSGNPVRLTLQTGANRTLTGSYGAWPCQGAYSGNKFTLLCTSTTYADTPRLITGIARGLEPVATLGKAPGGSAPTIDGWRHDLRIGERHNGQAASFRATRAPAALQQ
jgi:hypothetical protein